MAITYEQDFAQERKVHTRRQNTVITYEQIADIENRRSYEKQENGSYV